MNIEIEKLWDYADGFLPEVEREALEIMLRQDPQARQLLEGIMAEKQGLLKMSLEKTKPMFADKVMAAWVSEQVNNGSIVPSTPRRDWILTLISLVFGLFILGSLTALILNVGSIGNLGYEMPNVNWVNILGNATLKYTLFLAFAYMTFRLVERYWQYRKFTLINTF